MPKCHLSFLKLLHENGADLSAKDSENNTVIHAIQISGTEKEERWPDYDSDRSTFEDAEERTNNLGVLLQSDSVKFDLKQRNDHKRTVLHTLARDPFSWKSVFAIVALNEAEKDLLPSPDKDGNTFVHIAVETCTTKSLGALVELLPHSNVNYQNNEGRTVLHHYLHHRSIKGQKAEWLVIKSLIEADAKIAYSDNDGNGILHACLIPVIRNAFQVDDIVEKLLQADDAKQALELKNKSGITAAEVAQKWGSECPSELSEYESKLSPKIAQIMIARAKYLAQAREEEEIGRAVQQECRDRSRMPSSA
eukprot:TRINITY_DN9858_c0_g1_i1.p1 TRINITY_DN9858_c0_g1~~TRINITY_DN9858_c0_g1_i1.p1  ORF type:complete len:307 (+),score=48.99 TRINITY_DN9858_c0_g1_i1:155-1075(+)